MRVKYSKADGLLAVIGCPFSYLFTVIISYLFNLLNAPDFASPLKFILILASILLTLYVSNLPCSPWAPFSLLSTESYLLNQKHFRGSLSF